MKLRRSILIPLVLLAYLAVMAVIGYRQLSTGQMSPTEYYGVIVITLVVIALLHLSLRRRERLRREREDDIKRNSEKENKNNE